MHLSFKVLIFSTNQPLSTIPILVKNIFSSSHASLGHHLLPIGDTKKNIWGIETLYHTYKIVVKTPKRMVKFRL